MSRPSRSTGSSRLLYSRYLLLVSGLGGLLYGIDVGIIAAALLYLDRTIHLSLQQTSAIVAAVLAGGVVSSLAGGLLADLFGRRRMMILSGLCFLASIGIIVLSQSFLPLLLGRLLQGMSGGILGVVIPLYLAETLSAETRGRGTAIFQFMLTLGIVVAAFTGLFFTRQAEAAITAAHGNPLLIQQAANHAWRGMFASVLLPGILFTVGSLFLSESPRWLALRGRHADARAALLRSVPPQEAELELAAMQPAPDATGTAHAVAPAATLRQETLLQRKYVLPFLLACSVLVLNQTTGINSILAYLVVILRQAGLSANHAAQGDVVVKLLNCLITLLAIWLVDRKGRRFLLIIGTTGVTIALALGGLVFLHAENQMRDITAAVQQQVHHGSLQLSAAHWQASGSHSTQVLTLLYALDGKEQIATLRSSDPPLMLASAQPLTIRRARIGPLPAPATGWLITAALSLFIASFAIGPGVVVWLMLSELMPTRIRAVGMGIALLLNLAVSTLIADLFLPVVDHFGYSTMFFFWSACTLLYLAISLFLLPETRGRTLEEIERGFSQS